MSVVIGFVVLIVAAVIESTASTPQRRAVLTAALSGASVLVFVTLTAWSWGVRGGRPGSAMFLTGLLALYGFYRLVCEGTVGDIVAPDDGALVGTPRLRPAASGRTVAVGVAGILAMVAWTVPLRFGGALVNEPTGTAVAAAMSFGQFAPIGVKREVAVGQCLETRLVERENVVVPCDHPHKAEVIGEVTAPDGCPDVDASAFDAGEMRVVRTEPMSGVTFCVLQALHPGRRWRRVPPAPGTPGELPNTL